MAKILLSIPDDLLKKIDMTKDAKKMKRNHFIINAVEKYFLILWEEDYFQRKKRALESMKKTRKKIMSLGIKDWDPVAEIRRLRDGRADELLERWKEE
jgi:metal-responsive CopG/Arc/MetJ family transcriptional regulator